MMVTRARTSLSIRLRRAPTRYEPTTRIAAGGMAEVWRAEAVFENGEVHPVAIKRVLPELVDKPIFRSMFEDEARLGMALRHPNIVRVYDARDVAGTFIMVMELVEGTSLKDLLSRAHSRNAPMPVPIALFIALQLAQALDYAHHAVDHTGTSLGIIHRDVSPHNLLLSRSGEVKLMDFGLADARLHQTQMDESMLGGKLAYLAPEIIRQSPGDHRVDLFALGVVLWEMLTGRRLFLRDDDQETIRAIARHVVPTAQKVNPRIPDSLQRFLDELLAPLPEERTSSAAKVIADIRDILEEVDGEVGPADVGLLVGLHLATEAFVPAKPSRALAEVITHELAEFAAVAAGTETEIGAPTLELDLDALLK
jgi:serine/threonine protein kinase